MRICDDLRQAVLQAAIQGKLTKQLPEDGNAADLLKEIAKEKAQIIKEGKIKKEKPLPEITVDEIPFDIPDNWKWCHLGNAIKEIIVPQRDKPPFSCNGIIPWCRIEDRDGKFLHGTKSNQYVSKETIDTMNLKVLPVGTVLTACTGGSIGTIVINTKPCCTNQTFNGIVCGNKIYNWYVFWFLVSKFQELKTLGSGTTIAYVSQDKTRAMLFPLPPLAEQHRIVARVEELMARIDDLEKTETELEKLKAAFPGDMKAALLQAAIQGKLTEQLPEDGDAKDLLDVTLNSVIDGRKVKEKEIVDIAEDDKEFDIPANWQWVRLGSVCIVARGGSPRPIKDYITDSSDGINWIKIGDTDKGGKYITSVKERIKPSGVSKSRFVHSGDFLLTNSMSFGRPYILKVDGCIHDGWLVISQPKKVFDDDYLYWLLSSNFAYMQFCGKVSGAVVKNLNSDKVANSIFPLPPLAEQKRIVEKLDKLLPLCDGLVEE